MLVELADGERQLRAEDTAPVRRAWPGAAAGSRELAAEPRAADARPRRPRTRVVRSRSRSIRPAAGGEPRAADGIREVRRLFQSAPNPPRWPMYVRQAKQFLRNVDPPFDERKFGFGSLLDLLRACQRDGLFRIERDRQGVIRLFPGNVMQPFVGADDPEDEDDLRAGDGAALG